jgi:hypothetical protein
MSCFDADGAAETGAKTADAATDVAPRMTSALRIALPPVEIAYRNSTDIYA